jgi:hypothetical protein
MWADVNRRNARYLGNTLTPYRHMALPGHSGGATLRVLFHPVHLACAYTVILTLCTQRTPQLVGHVLQQPSGCSSAAAVVNRTLLNALRWCVQGVSPSQEERRHPWCLVVLAERPQRQASLTGGLQLRVWVHAAWHCGSPLIHTVKDSPCSVWRLAWHRSFWTSECRGAQAALAPVPE